jgi:nucleoside-diphosphate-sugar epimerase
MAMTRLIRSAITGDEFQLFGDGRQRRDFTFVDDVVRANLLAAEWLLNQTHGGLVFNVGNNRPCELMEVISIVEEIVGRKVNLRWRPRQEGDPIETGASSRLLQETVGWSQTTTLHQGLRRHVDWFRSMESVLTID